MHVGDKVQFSAGFLKATGQLTGPDAPTDIGPFARGTVIDLTPISNRYVAHVQWANNRVSKVLELNLEVIK